MATQNEILHTLWLKAIGSSGPVEVPCKDKSTAVRLRWALYNSVSAIRKGIDTAAPAALVEGIDSIAIRLVKQGAQWLVVLGKKADDPALQAALAAIGDATLATAEGLAAAESEAAALRKLGLGQEDPQPSATPYYTRER